MVFERPSYIAALWSALILSGCFGNPSYLRQDNDTGNRWTTVGIAATNTDSGVISAAIKADDARSQLIKADDVKELKGTSIIVPPGALSIDVTIKIEEAVPLATTTLAQQLGISGQFTASGTAISVQADKDVTLKKPFGIALPIPGMTTLTLADPYANLFVIYKVKNAETGEILLGIIPRGDLEIINGEVRFSTIYLGAFQVAFAEQPVESKKIVTDEPILTKREEVTATVASLTLNLGNLAADGWINAEESQASSALFIVSKASHKDVTYSQVLSDNPLLVCNEKVDYKLKDIPIVKNIPNADGTYAICARIVNELKKPHFFKSPIIKKDATPPTVDVGITRSEIGPFSINAQTQGAVKWTWSKVSGPGNITFSAPQAEDTAVSVDATGTYILRLAVEDEAGNKASGDITAAVSLAPSLISLSLSGEATGGYINNQEKNSTNPLISINALNATAIYYYLAVQGTTCNGSLSYNATLPTAQHLTEDLPYIVCIKLVGADNSSIYNKSPVITRDTQAPIINVGSNAVSMTPVTRTAWGIDIDSVLWTQQSGPGVITFSQTNILNTTIAADTDGSYVIRATAKDIAGNEAYAEFILQWGAGLAGALTPANEANDGYINANEKSANTEIFTLTHMAATSITYTTLLSGTPDCDASLTYSESSIPTINTIPPVDGSYTLCAKLMDALSNVVYVRGVVERDTTPPTVNVGPDQIKNQTFVLDASTSGAVSFHWTKISGSEAVTFGTQNAEDTPVTISADGGYTIRLTVTDAAGNQTYDELFIEWDTTPPALPVILFAFDADDGYINADESASTSFMFTISLNGATMNVSAAQASGVTCDANINYLNTNVPQPIDLESTDGSYVFCLKLQDVAGNITYAATPPVIKDTMPPTGPLIVTGVPKIVSEQISLTINVSGTDMNRFEYQIGPLASNCNPSPPYTMTAGLTETVNIASLADGPLQLCLIGVDLAGNSQPYANATIRKWHKAATSMQAIQIAVGTAHVCALFNNHKVRCWGKNTEGQLGYESTNNLGDNASEMNNLAEVNLGTNVFVKQIATGGNHTCALTLDGKVKCWGDNSFGQRGVGGSLSAGEIAGTMGDNLAYLNFGTGIKVKKLALGQNHSCALLADHTVKCWGDNSKAQLGISSYSSINNVLTASAVDLDKKIIDISAGVNRTCAILDDHSAKCWGDNIGEATGMSSSYPVGGIETPMNSVMNIIFGTKKPRLIVTGMSHTCALMDDHQTKCWGAGGTGQLGHGSTSNILAAGIGSSNVVASGLSYHRQITLGNQHSCALMDDFSVKCWGYNINGELGIGNTTNQTQPSFTSLPNKAVQVVSGSSFTCALLVNSNIACWGKNESGQIGQGTTTSYSTPQLISFGANSALSVLSLSTHSNHTCALLSDHSLRCWGNNSGGQLGIGHNTDHGRSASQMGENLPAVSLGAVAAIQVVTGANHTCALISTGDVMCWGSGNLGQGGVGSSSTNISTNLINFGGSAKPVKIVAGGNHTCAMFPDSGIKCWGSNDQGQLGQGVGTTIFTNNSSEIYALSSVNLGSGRKAIDIFARASQTCAILDNHTLKCWGYNNQGQLGQSDFTMRGKTPSTLGDSLAPISLGVDRKVVDVTMGLFLTCALLDDGSTKCFGANDQGQAGQSTGSVYGPAAGSTGDNLFPVNLGTTQIAQAIAAGTAHTCALLYGGIVKCFGSGVEGALGSESSGNLGPNTGQMGDSLPPVNFGTNLKATQVVTGVNHTCVLTQLGWVKCWGNSNYGQLGLESTDSHGHSPGTMSDELDFVRLW